MASVRVEVVYALPGRQECVELLVDPGTRADDAVVMSGLASRHRIPAAVLRLGIGGRPVPPDHALTDGDRVEILRPLAADPQVARRERARRSGRRR
jgi:putative ubiquitin-RnfH superfamily antitoxin RatB of RatAB toxin-antitoxin module